jgi:two-component system, OmpR family, sensor histidine kinase KdpD
MQMLRARTPGRPELLRVAALVVAGLGASTLAIALLRAGIHVTYPAPVYLLAVLAVGMRRGTVPAVVTSVAAFLLYDFLFVEPLYTLTISSPDEWLNLLLLLAVATVIGRLAALQTERAREAADRAEEAEALYAITGVLASTRTVAEAGPVVVRRLCELTAMDRVWVSLNEGPSGERTVADTAPAEPLPVPGWQVVLQRKPDGHMRWIRAHVAGAGAGRGARGSARAALHRIRIEVAGETLGSVWALRARNETEPDRAETRILSAAADQLGQAVIRDRLGQEATSAEIARQSEALKTALLDSVSHDLRTPLATIRAAAGSMLDQDVEWSAAEQHDAFEVIDSEAERMGRLVRNLLDLSRIEGGALRPDLEARDAREIAAQAVGRLNSPGKHIEIEFAADLPAVLVDEIYLSQVLSNLLENAVRYGGRTIEVRGRAVPGGPGEAGTVALSVEDDGEGVPDSSQARLFEKFFQVPRAGNVSKQGMGIGLTVVAGLVRAMGGQVRAERSALGGLSVVVTLSGVDVPAEPESLAEAAR